MDTPGFRNCHARIVRGGSYSYLLISILPAGMRSEIDKMPAIKSVKERVFFPPHHCSRPPGPLAASDAVLHSHRGGNPHRGNVVFRI